MSRYYLSPGKLRCKGTSRWMYAADGDKRCRFPAARDGYCKRHHPEYILAAALKRIATYERLIREDREVVKSMEEVLNATARF